MSFRHDRSTEGSGCNVPDDLWRRDGIWSSRQFVEFRDGYVVQGIAYLRPDLVDRLLEVDRSPTPACSERTPGSADQD